jgi:H+/Cl- antiporter ClcA
VNWALPLTVGNGNLITKAAIKFGGQLSDNLLWATVFARMFTLGVSMNCGFVGGFIFPMITIGLIVGVIAHNNYDEYPIGLMISCFLAAVPSGICPMPFTMLGIPTFIFFLGLQQTVPVFISCIVAYTMFTGIGIFGALAPKPEPDAHQKTEGNAQQGNDAVEKYAAKPTRGSLGKA